MGEFILQLYVLLTRIPSVCVCVCNIIAPRANIIRDVRWFTAFSYITMFLRTQYMFNNLQLTAPGGYCICGRVIIVIIFNVINSVRNWRKTRFSCKREKEIKGTSNKNGSIFWFHIYYILLWVGN